MICTICNIISQETKIFFQKITWCEWTRYPFSRCGNVQCVYIVRSIVNLGIVLHALAGKFRVFSTAVAHSCFVITDKEGCCSYTCHYCKIFEIKTNFDLKYYDTKDFKIISCSNLVKILSTCAKSVHHISQLICL